MTPNPERSLKAQFEGIGRAYPLAMATTQMTSNKATFKRFHEATNTGDPEVTITYAEIFIVRFADGRIAETWGVVDVASQMNQLGVLPG